MAKQKDEYKQVSNLPQGWVWVYKGKEQWVTSQGKVSDERHAKNLLSGKTLSVKQVQNQQRETRAALGQPKAPAIKRTGKIRTQKFARRDKAQRFGELHGETRIYTFYDIDSAEAWVKEGHIPKNLRMAIIQARYTKALGVAGPKSDPYAKKGGYVNLTSYASTSILERGVSKTGVAPWEEARAKLPNFDMSGSNARIYVFASER